MNCNVSIHDVRPNNLYEIIKIVDIALTVDSKSTARIQEAHRTIYHVICELVEKNLTM